MRHEECERSVIVWIFVFFSSGYGTLVFTCMLHIFHVVAVNQVFFVNLWADEGVPRLLEILAQIRKCMLIGETYSHPLESITNSTQRLNEIRQSEWWNVSVP